MLADYLSDVGISASQVGRILAELGIKPHQVRGWITRKDDPAFWERAADVCALYLSKPTNALVLSVDEKTAIAARSRKHPTSPRRRAGPSGWSSSTAGMAPLRSSPPSMCTRATWWRPTFLATPPPISLPSWKRVDADVEAGLDVHLILDNGSSHVAKATKAWLAAHPRFHVHHTPKHASWLNQVELVFSILTRRLLRRGEFGSREELVAKIMAWIAEYDRTAKPFAWTYDGKPLKVA